MRTRPKKSDSDEAKLKEIVESEEIKSDSPALTTKTTDSDLEVAQLTQKSPIRGTDTPNTSQHSTQGTPLTVDRSRHSQSVSVSAVNDDSQDISDQELEFQSFHRDEATTKETYLRRSASRHIQELREFGGNIGSLILMLLIPAFVILISFFCSAPNAACQLFIPTENAFKHLSTYCNHEIGTVFLVFVLGMLPLTALPIGRKVTLTDDSESTSHRFTGLSCAFFTLLSLFVAKICYKYPILKIISDNYFQLAILSITYAFVAAILSNIKAKFALQTNLNPYAKSNGILGNFFTGREINPTIFGYVNLKLVHYHISIILALVLNTIILYNNIQIPQLPELAEGELELDHLEKAKFLILNMKFETVTVLAAGLMVVYLLDLLVFEHHLSCSFELQSEGLGAFVLLRYAVFPFTLTLMPNYVTANPIEVPMWCVVLIAVIFLVGLYVKRASNKIKYEYRMNPLGSKFISKS